MSNLHLNFDLNGYQPRKEFLDKYLAENNVQAFSEKDLEMMSNYLLWGAQTEQSLNFDIESKNSPWSKKEISVSFDDMIEREHETGAPVHTQLSDIQIKTQKKKLDRKEVLDKLKDQDASLKTSWLILWGNIDKTEFMVQNWELEHGKRRPDLPIREELHERLRGYALWKNIEFAELEDQLIAEQRKWTGYEFIKQKRSLVQMRTQQYTLLDSTQYDGPPKRVSNSNYWSEKESAISNFYPFDSEKLLLPEINEDCFSREFAKHCIAQLQYADAMPKKALDLRQPEAIRNILLMKNDLEDAIERREDSEAETLKMLIKYIEYYIKQANFPPELLLIMNSKINKISNKEITVLLKEQFNLDYQENYISTIFTKRIIEEIAKQAELHYKMIEYILMGRTVFKRCSKCGRLLPRNTTYFNKRASTSDGFFSHCKECRKSAK